MTTSAPAPAPAPIANQERDWPALIARFLAGAMLFYAGFMKLNASADFATTIANFRMLPAVANQLLAVVLPWCEVAAGLMLIGGVWPRAAGIVAAILFLAFAVAASSAVLRGLDIQCGCFGTASARRVGVLTVGVDLAGLIASALVVFAREAAAPHVPVTA